MGHFLACSKIQWKLICDQVLFHCQETKHELTSISCENLQLEFICIFGHIFRWIEGHWGECSVDCGPGEQTQIMHCVKTNTSGNSEYVLDETCLRNIGTQPLVKRVCYGEADDCPYWATGSWSEVHYLQSR